MTKLAKDLTNAVIRALDDNADLVVPVGIEPFLKNRDNKFFLDGSLSYGHTTAVMGGYLKSLQSKFYKINLQNFPY